MKDTPKDRVKEYLDKYVKNDDVIKDDIDTFLANSTYDEDGKDRYKEILLNHYKELKYDIKDETINGDNASVETKITVYDNYLVSKDANAYLLEHADEFNTNGAYDESKFLKYKLDMMNKNEKKVDYTITFSLTKEDNKWVLNQPSNLVLEKIHGIYNYES